MQPQQLEGAPGRQVLLELAMLGHHFLRHPRVAQQLQQHVDGLRQRRQGFCPALQRLLAPRGAAVLPSVVTRQIEAAGTPWNADAAADAHQPVVLGQRLARLATLGVERLKAIVQLREHPVKRTF